MRKIRCVNCKKDFDTQELYQSLSLFDGEKAEVNCLCLKCYSGSGLSYTGPIETNSTQDSFWQNRAYACIQNIVKCKSIIESGPIFSSVSTNLKKKIDSFIRQSEEGVFQIAFVGTIKAGKSTLINSLLEKELASTSVTPETAVVTKFATSKSDRHILRVSFYSLEDWNALWEEAIHAYNSEDKETKDKVRPFIEDYNSANADTIKANYIGHKDLILELYSDDELRSAISKYTSSVSPAHYFVKEVFCEIKDSNIPQRVVLCDTPGLDDVLEYRSNVTKQYIKHANAVIVCVESSFLGGEQLHTIQKVFSLNRLDVSRVYIIGTKIDNLPNPIDDWKKQKAAWVGYLKGSACFNDIQLAESNIIGVSASINNRILNIENIRPSSPEHFALCAFISHYTVLQNPMDIFNNPDMLATLKSASNIYNIWDVIRTKLFNKFYNASEQQLFESYRLLADDIKKQMNELITISKREIEAIADGPEALEMQIKYLLSEIQSCEQESIELEEMLGRLREIEQDSLSEVTFVLNSI